MAHIPARLSSWQTQPVHLANHGIARNPANAAGDLAGAQAIRP
jgi:hypothetical protein